MQYYRNGAYKHRDLEDYEHEGLSLLCMKVAVPRSEPISRSAFSTAVAKRHKPQELATPVCSHARSALSLVWLQLDSRIGDRPIPGFAVQFPWFFDNPDTDRRLALDCFFCLRSSGFFCRVCNGELAKYPAKSICLE